MSNLKVHLIIWPVLFALGLALVGILYGIHTMIGDMPQAMVNCSIAEISPDFTTKQREECRKLKGKQ